MIHINFETATAALGVEIGTALYTPFKCYTYNDGC